MCIAPAYYSRVSNKEVFRRAGDALPLGRVILADQLKLFGDIAGSSQDALRDAVFDPGTLSLARLTGTRCRGRPRHTWSEQVKKHALAAANGNENLEALILNEYNRSRWKQLIHKYVQSLPF